MGLRSSIPLFEGLADSRDLRDKFAEVQKISTFSKKTVCHWGWVTVFDASLDHICRVECSVL